MNMFGQSYDPGVRTQYRTIVGNVWQNVLRGLGPYTTDAERMGIQQQFSMEIENWVTRFMDTQAQRGYLDQNQIYQMLLNWANQVVQSFRARNAGYGFGGGMPMGGMPMGGMSAMPMGMRPAPMGPPMGQPPVGGSPAAASMAAMYGAGNPSAPELPKAVPPVSNIVQSVAPEMTATPTPTASTAPSVKITPSTVAYKEPQVCKTYSVNNPQIGVTGSVREYQLGDSSRFTFATLALKKWVTSVGNTLKSILKKNTFNGVALTYRTWVMTNLTCSTMIKAMSNIKDIIQKSEGEDSVAVINAIVASLINESQGCNRFFEKCAVNTFNKYVCTTGHVNMQIKTFDDISELITSTHDNQLLVMIDNILHAVIDVFKDMVIYDPASEEVLPYLADEVVKKGKTFKQLKEEDAESFNKFCKEWCFIVSPERKFIYIDRNFPDMACVEIVGPVEQKTTVASQLITLNDSPIDNDVEYFVKSMVVDTCTFDLVLATNNMTVTYQVAKAQTTDIGLAPKNPALL